jgi:hypothetical protein
MKATTLGQKYSVALLGTSLTLLATSISANATSLYSATQITAPGIDTYNAVKITDNGQVLVRGTKVEADTVKGSAFVWQAGQTRSLEFPADPQIPGSYSDFDVKDINESGTVIGFASLYDVVSEGVGYYGIYGFAWNGGKIDLTGGPKGYYSPYGPYGSYYHLNDRGQFIEPVNGT